MPPAKLKNQVNIEDKVSKANASNCEKVELANSMGLRMIYCGDCKVVELEIGAVSLRLCPDVVQRIANMMMKASLQLDRIVNLPAKVETLSEVRMIH